ncbi:MAG: hypothetical protein WAO35_24900 [Terriglobia bacterium]
MHTPIKGRKWSADDTVALVFAFIGFGGSVVFVNRIPAIEVAFFLATGVAALVYKFLGGIDQGTSFRVGALRLGGTLAGLVGIALLVNLYLSTQLQLRLVSADDIVGEWKWEYARGGQAGNIDIQKGPNGNFTFTGEMEQYSDERSFVKYLTLTNGKATLKNNSSLELEADVRDDKWHDYYHWNETAPLRLIPAFYGSMRATHPDGSVTPDRWGIMFYKDKE